MRLGERLRGQHPARVHLAALFVVRLAPSAQLDESTKCWIDEVEHRLEEALQTTALPDLPDDDAVNAFLVDALRQAWGW